MAVIPNALTFITGVKFYKNILDQLNHITYIYDPKWNPNNFTKATFPVCFFSVKGMHEVMSTEVSTKQMLFYNSSTGANDIDPSADSGLLNVVADNIVIKPKSYKLDLIIPYSDLSLLNQSFVYNTQTMEAITSAILKSGGEVKKVTNSIASVASLTTPCISFVKDILRTLLVQNYNSNVEQIITNVMSQPDYNKNSLECMWLMRRVLKIKLWNSWSYKYVIITDLDISKEGTEDGVYEASLTVQEVPIATLRSKSEIEGLIPFTYKNKALLDNGNKAINLLDTAGKLGE